MSCRNRLRAEGKPYPRSGCAVCKTGGLTGCPYERSGHLTVPSDPPAMAGEVVTESATTEVNPEGERLYAEYLRDMRAELLAEDLAPQPLNQAVRFVERWLPDMLPANNQGQVPFARAVVEILIDSANATLAAIKVSKKEDASLSELSPHQKYITPARLAEARARGRHDGLEEAARIAEDTTRYDGPFTSYGEHAQDGYDNAREDVVVAIRARIPLQSDDWTTGEGS